MLLSRAKRLSPAPVFFLRLRQVSPLERFFPGISRHWRAGAEFEGGDPITGQRQTYGDRFLPPDVVQARPYSRHAVSVCLSDTFVDYVKTNKTSFFHRRVATPF